MAKTVLITGAGSGIGKALAFRLAGAGLNVVICGRRANVLNEVANAPEACNKIRVVVADVASAEGCDALKKALGETPLDILVHNAGVFTVAHLETVDRDTWRKCMAVNAEAPIFLTQALSANLKAAETKARVLIIGSGAADINIPTMNVYCGSKALVKHIWKSLNMDMGTVADFAYCKVGLAESDMTGSMPGNDDLLIKDNISDRLRSGDVHPADEVAGWLQNLFEPKLVDAEAFKTREHDIDNPAHQLGMKIRLTTEGKAFLGQETSEQNTCFLAKLFGRR